MSWIVNLPIAIESADSPADAARQAVALIQHGADTKIEVFVSKLNVSHIATAFETVHVSLNKELQ